MIYKLSMADNYPDSYWFDFSSKKFANLKFNESKKIAKPLLNKSDIVYEPVSIYSRKISTNNFLSYDFLVSSGGPRFISPRFAELLTQLDGINNDLQLIDATVIVNDITYTGYKAINPIRSISCIDMNKSDHKIWYPLGDNNPDNSMLIFDEVVFKDEIQEEFYIARCLEEMLQIVVSEKFKEFAIKNKIKGIGFS